MSQAITFDGEKLFATQAQLNEKLNIDTFIFANIPGLDPSLPIDRTEQLPPVEQRVFTQQVQQTGKINENIVVYSTVLESNTGPFQFNWVGLYSSVHQKLIAIQHIPTVSKTTNDGGSAGNTLNRNFGIEYSGISELTDISVSPETWQLDFTARLQGMDELTRLLSSDMNGKNWFINDGFKVTARSTENSFSITQGVGYISGLRIELSEQHILSLQSYPQNIYVDAYFEGSASSKWEPKFVFLTSNEEIADYIDNGTQHFICKLATIHSKNHIEELRSNESLSQAIEKKLDKVIGPVEMTEGTADNLLMRRSEEGPTRAHIEPKGNIEEGTVTKLDLMFDPYEEDKANYRIVNLYTKNGPVDGNNGENGVAVLGLKATGNHWGVWPSLHVGFQDDGVNGVPLKIMMFDTSDTTWRTPMKGAWYPNKAINSGDHVLAGGKLYRATSSGNCGDNIPTHTSGIASDGNIYWQFIRNFSAAYQSIKPVVVIGDRDSKPLHGFPNVRLQLAGDSLVHWGKGFRFVDSEGKPFAKLSSTGNGEDDFITLTLESGGLFQIHKDKGYLRTVNLADVSTGKVFLGAETAVDVSKTRNIVFDNSQETLVNRFSKGEPYQRFTVLSENLNTSIEHNGYIKLKSGENYSLDGNHGIDFIFDRHGIVAKQVC